MKKLLLILTLLFINCSILIAQENLEPPINTIREDDTGEVSKGNKFFLNGNYSKAIDFYEKATKEKEGVAYYNLGVTYYLLGQYKESKRALLQSIKAGYKDRDVYINLASTYMMLGDYEKAQSILEDYIPDNGTPAIYTNLGNIFLHLGETAKAYYYLQKAVSLGGDSFYANISLANYFLSIGDNENAEKILNNISPKGFLQNLNMGKIYFNMGNHLLSNEYLEKALVYYETAELYKLMAKNYAVLGNYSLQSDVLKKVMELEPNDLNRINYAVSLYCGGYTDRSFDFLKSQIKLDQDNTYYKFLYSYLLFIGNNMNTVKDYLKSLYDYSPDVENLYLYVKYLIISKNDKYITQAINIIKNNNIDNPYINLVKSILEIFNRDYYKALRFVNNINVETLNRFQKEEYYIIKCFIHTHLAKFDKVLQIVDKIPYYRAEYFWYKFIALWNNDNLLNLLQAIKEGHYSCLNKKRNKDLSISFKPLITDMDLSYTFYNRPVDIIEHMVFPILMDANEVAKIMNFGSQLINENQADIALSTLMNSLSFIKAIDLNNSAVQHLIEGNYYRALDMLKEANIKLPSNPIILYNIGLTYKYIGNQNKALLYFSRSESSSRYFYPASIVKAIIYYKTGKAGESRKLFSNIYNSFNENNALMDLPNFIIYMKYLAGIVVDNPSNVENRLISDKLNTEYGRLILDICRYIKGGKEEALQKIKNNNSYHSDYLYNFISLYNDNSNLIKIAKEDRVYRFTTYFIEFYKGKRYKIEYDKSDKYELKEAFFYHILNGNYGRAYNNLVKIFDETSDSYYPNELALYYYMVVDDKVNAEGAYNALERSSLSNYYSDYYKLIYMLLNSEYKNLEDKLSDFKEKFPSSNRLHLVNAIYHFDKGDLNLLEDDINMLLKDKNNLEFSLPLKINIESL
ncbi:MAG: hypothetical protein SVN78_03955 [Deferribacterota bacterium]|nr:hypothetical protein [Deferribacterota bacterium]